MEVLNNFRKNVKWRFQNPATSVDWNEILFVSILLLVAGLLCFKLSVHMLNMERNITICCPN